MQRCKSKWLCCSVLFVAAICLFGSSAVTYGSPDSQSITDKDCETILKSFYNPTP
jgi:hypothetical protein